MEISRLLKVYFAKSRVKVMEAFEYRSDFIMITLATYGYNAAALIFLEVLFSHINTLAGWSKAEIILLYGTAELINFLYGVFFEAASKKVQQMIFNGKIDSYLLKPTSAFFNLLTDSFNLIEHAPALMLALGIVAYGYNQLNISFGWHVLLYISLVICSVIFQAILRMILSLLAFWTTDSEEYRRFFYRLEDRQYIPLDAYPRGFRELIMTAIPIGLVSYVPTKILLGTATLPLILNYFAVFIIFLVLTRWLWFRGLKVYSSISS
jgi:ABC-2 type transport system permease protein